MKRLIKEYQEYVNKMLLPHMQQKLGFNKPPIINFVEDEQNAKDVFGKTAFYDPTSMEITVFVSGRHPKDIMRSVAHEIVHHNQNCKGEFDKLSNIGEQGYAQSNPHLRTMEKQAYLLGNMIFRDWEDNYKKQRNITGMTESTLRQKIRSLIKESMEQMGGDSMASAVEVENVPTKEHYAGDECEPSDPSHIKYLEAMEKHNLQGYAAKRDDNGPAITEQVSLKDWRNNELNSLLLRKFKIVSPQVLSESLNEEKKPMKKDTEDVDNDGNTEEMVPAYLKKGSVKKKKSSGKVPPQLQKYVKSKQEKSEKKLDERELTSDEKKELKGLHKTRKSMLKSMIKQYGKEKGTQVFNAKLTKDVKEDK